MKKYASLILIPTLIIAFTPTLAYASKDGTTLRNEFKNRTKHITLSCPLDHDPRAYYQSLYKEAIENTSSMYEGFHIEASLMHVNKSFLKTDSDYHIELDVDYTTNRDEEDELKRKVNSLASLLRRKSEYEKVKAIHDYLIQHTSYSLNSNKSYCAYGALIDHKAVCNGYADAFMLLTRSLGLRCNVVTGHTSKGEYHAWNQVCVNNSYYNIDVTFDDLTSSHKYFLKSDAAFFYDHRDDHKHSSYACKNNYSNKTIRTQSASIDKRSLVFKKLSASKTKIYVKWNEIKSIRLYQLSYRIKGKKWKSKKTGKTSMTLTKLKRKKTYQFKLKSLQPTGYSTKIMSTKTK